MSNNNNIIIVMSSCETCKAFINILNSNKMLQYFNIINIDTRIQEFKNKGIKQVPTLFFNNQQIEGGNCIIWVKQFLMQKQQQFQHTQQIQQNYSQQLQQSQQLQNDDKLIGNNNIVRNKPLVIDEQQKPVLTRQQQQQQILEQKRKQATMPPPSVQPTNEIFGYLKSEFGSFSDSYTFVDEKANSLPQTFLKPTEDLIIYTAPEGAKINKSQQELEMKRFKSARKREEDNIGNQFDKDINRLVNNNKQIEWNNK